MEKGGAKQFGARKKKDKILGNFIYSNSNLLSIL